MITNNKLKLIIHLKTIINNIHGIYTNTNTNTTKYEK